ncbi:MAG: hypothetical protein JNM09_07320 [Blastocatellia bacterium]|nr:hypothetical protein [Blastocatellia bacterium]
MFCTAARKTISISDSRLS